jgi:hypothetical protein
MSTITLEDYFPLVRSIARDFASRTPADFDDLGAEKVTDWVDETLFKIINYRYQREMPSVLTSNEGVNRLPGRVASRVKEMAETVFLAVSDYREVIAERRRHAEVAPA